jgi:hypothetical protein
MSLFMFPKINIFLRLEYVCHVNIITHYDKYLIFNHKKK